MKVLTSDPAVTEGTDEELTLDPAWLERMLVAFLTRELRRTGKQRLVLGLSGGIDSAVSAWLAARAIGAKNVLGVRMPYRTSNPSSLSDATLVADSLGIRTETVDISAMVDGFIDGSGDVGRHRLGNVMARVRMVVVFDRSFREDALVVGTSNKTELLLGYGTLHGDLASAINPIGDLYKTQVRELAAHLGVPEPIRTKTPSADLWPDQSDEQDLGSTYAELDALLARLVDARMSRERVIADGFAPELVDRVTRMIVRSQFKRRPPVIARVSLRAIGWDFRYPRDWLT